MVTQAIHRSIHCVTLFDFTFPRWQLPNAVTLPAVSFFFFFFPPPTKPTGWPSAESREWLLPKYLWAGEIRVRMGRGGEWMKYRCVVPFGRHSLLPGDSYIWKSESSWIIIKEPWRSPFLGRGDFLPWGISAFSSDVSNVKLVVHEKRRKMYKFSDRKCCSDLLRFPTWSLNGSQG